VENSESASSHTHSNESRNPRNQRNRRNKHQKVEAADSELNIRKDASEEGSDQNNKRRRGKRERNNQRRDEFKQNRKPRSAETSADSLSSTQETEMPIESAKQKNQQHEIGFDQSFAPAPTTSFEPISKNESAATSVPINLGGLVQVETSSAKTQNHGSEETPKAARAPRPRPVKPVIPDEPLVQIETRK
jgi:hypothetical protein